MKAKRNGKIEILRFIFCLCVILYHINGVLWDGKQLITANLSFFSHGRTAVEFFFLVTGYLTAKSAAKLAASGNRVSIGRSTYEFVLKKIKSVFTPHIILCTLVIVLYAANGKMTMEEFFDRFPSLFFLQTTGVTDGYFISVEWYICSMLFAIVIIYPLLLKNFDFTSKVIAPVGSSLLIGYMISKYNCLPSAFNPDPFISPDNLRGLAVVLLGVFCYTVSERIKAADLTRTQKYFLIAAENFCWIVSLYFMVSTLSGKYEGIIVYVLALAVTLTFSRSFENKFYNHTFVMYLGRISLTTYLSQSLVWDFVKFNLHCSETVFVILVMVLTILMGMIMDFVPRKIKLLKSSNNS